MNALSAFGTMAECDWPVTNCYIDAWTQILLGWGLDPAAGLGVTVTQDYEGDQFTFFKYLHEDLEQLYGVLVGELSIYTTLEQQVRQQVEHGNVVLVEVDGYHLPDTRATSYRSQHTKTTIGIDAIDADAGRLGYFHNTGRHELSGEDYAAVFRKLPHLRHDDLLAPYVELAKRRWPPLRQQALAEAAAGLMRRHLRRRPEQSPIAAYRRQFPRDADWLMRHPHLFHEYAFNHFRQLGANFQLLGQHLRWLQTHGAADLAEPIGAAATVSATAKALQFKAARIAARRRFDPCDTLFATLEDSYQAVMLALDRRFT